MATADVDVQSFEKTGYLFPLTVCDTLEVDRYRKLFDELEQREGRETCQIGLINRHLDVPFIWELATHPKILDCIEPLMGPDIMVLATHFFCKYGQTEGFVAWHQDLTYWGLEPPCALTAWYAVDDADVENGCMQVRPGTHKQGIIEHGKSQRANNLLSINQEVTAVLDESTAVDMPLKAGQISIHDGMLVHGSNPNRSNRRRCGMTIRYCPPNVKPVAPNSLNQPWPAILVRGHDPYKNFGQWKLKF